MITTYSAPRGLSLEQTLELASLLIAGERVHVHSSSTHCAQVRSTVSCYAPTSALTVTAW